ncbi:MAG: lysoplasmalogenase [Deltaproteobacteria bacterium]|nr:lysoplasmalogenase [Deltaproteobacteria bacterium]
MAATTIILACILMPVLFYYETKEIPKGILPVKTTISLMFVLAALAQPRPVPAYFAWLLPGLIFCLGGDVFLALPQKKMFFLGLVSFLVGHLFYAICFFYTAPPSAWAILGALPVLIAGLLIFLRLKPHLGDMTLPVLVYIVVITFMVCGAFSLFLESGLAFSGRALALCGAICFYISDIFVARDRFVKKGPINRILGLPLYFGGQFLLAFSVGYL